MRQRDRIAEWILGLICRWPLASAWAFLFAFWFLAWVVAEM